MKRIPSIPFAMLFVAVFIIALGLLPRYSKPSFRHSLLHERLQAETVGVVTSHGEGSGVVVKRDGKVFVWTAAHVVKNVSSVEIHQRFRYNGKPAGEQVFSGHVICRLPDTDVALVWVDAPPDRLTGGHWASSTPGPGIPVLCVGNMLGRDLDGSVSAGIVSQNGVSPTNMESWPWKLVDQATVVAVPGSSGGPVFDARGDIVGIAVGWPGISSITFFVPLRVVYSAAQQANVTWAIYGSHAPIDKVLQDAVTSAAPPPVPQDIIRLLFGFDPAEPSK